MSNHGRVFAGVAMVMLLAAGSAWAKEGKGTDPQKHLDHLTKKLELSDAQRSQVQGIMNDYRGRIEGLKEQIEALKKEKHERIKAVLNAEQQAKFEKMKGHKGHGWFKKRGN